MSEQRRIDDYWQAYWGERFKSENEGYKNHAAQLEAELAAAIADRDEAYKLVTRLAQMPGPAHRNPNGLRSQLDLLRNEARALLARHAEVRSETAEG